LPLRGITSLYKEHVHPLIIQRRERGQRPNPISFVSCVSSVVLMGRETGPLQLLAPLLLTGGKGADLVIRGNVVLNKNNVQTKYIKRLIIIYIKVVAIFSAQVTIQRGRAV
jgi:hypothetical protein